jgi:hypothetical protein
MEITIKLDDHDTNPKHIEHFLSLLERVIVILEEEQVEDKEGDG